MTTASDYPELLRDTDARALADIGRAVLEIEARTLAQLVSRIDAAFVEAARLMLECDGRVVVLGMGKSGHVGGKIAATLASTGTPAFFVHPNEIPHERLGSLRLEHIEQGVGGPERVPERKHGVARRPVLGLVNAQIGPAIATVHVRGQVGDGEAVVERRVKHRALVCVVFIQLNASQCRIPS